MEASKILVVLSVVFFTLSLHVCNVDLAEALNTAVSAANNDFTKDVYANLAGSKQENAIISPFSLHVVLGMASFGAAGDTATAMMRGLRIKHSETLLKDYKGIIQQLSKSSEMTTASKIFVGQQVELNSSYQSKVLDNFNSEVGKVDFSQSSKAAEEMNNWVANQTNDKIKNLIDPASITSATRLVLINAIYFKGLWTTPFKKENTRNGPFYLDNTRSVQVPLMYMRETFYMYHEAGDDGYKMLEMPYGKKEDQQFSMHVFLPNRRDGLAALEKKLFETEESFAEKFGNIVKNTYSTEVEVTLPRFKIESTWNMNEFCKKTGMEIAFTDRGDFSSMTAGKTPLTITEVVQKAFIEVNEEGTEASTTTGMTANLRGESPSDIPPTLFNVDHPFLVMWLDDTHNIIIYIARVPNVSSS